MQDDNPYDSNTKILTHVYTKYKGGVPLAMGIPQELLDYRQNINKQKNYILDEPIMTTFPNNMAYVNLRILENNIQITHAH